MQEISYLSLLSQFSGICHSSLYFPIDNELSNLWNKYNIESIISSGTGNINKHKPNSLQGAYQLFIE